jgi:hypothetical protein
MPYAICRIAIYRMRVRSSALRWNCGTSAHSPLLAYVRGNLRSESLWLITTSRHEPSRIPVNTFTDDSQSALRTHDVSPGRLWLRSRARSSSVIKSSNIYIHIQPQWQSSLKREHHLPQRPPCAPSHTNAPRRAAGRTLPWPAQRA